MRLDENAMISSETLAKLILMSEAESEMSNKCEKT